MTFKEQLKYAREQQRREQQWSAKQAQKQMDFQERMSSTAHQREMADLQAAGLNPVLTATGGSGASAPTGAMADTSSLVNSISTMAMAAQQSAKAAHTAVKKIQKGDETPKTDNEGMNTGLQNLSTTQTEHQPYDFGDQYLNNIYGEVGDKPLGDTGWTIGQAMIVGQQVIGMATEIGTKVGEVIAHAAEEAGKGDWNKLPEEEKDIVAKYLARNPDAGTTRFLGNTYVYRNVPYSDGRPGTAKKYLRQEDMALSNGLYDASKAIRKAGLDKIASRSVVVKKYKLTAAERLARRKGVTKKYRNASHSRRSP